MLRTWIKRFPRAVPRHVLSPMLRSVFYDEEEDYTMYLLFSLIGDTDTITNTKATCQIDGTRYGVVDGVVTEFAPNVPAIVDVPGMPGIKGLRGCPSFVNLIPDNDSLYNWSYSGTSVTENYAQGPFINTYADRLQSTGSSTRRNTVCTVEPNTEYSFYFYAKDIASLAASCAVYDYNGTLGWIIAPESYLTEINKDEYSVVKRTFVTNNNCTSIGLYVEFNAGATVDLLIFGPQLTNGKQTLPYTPTIGTQVAIVSETGSTTNGISFDISAMPEFAGALNGPDAHGRIVLNFIPAMDSSWLTPGFGANLFTLSDTHDTGIFILVDGDGVQRFMAFDGVNTCAVQPEAFSVGDVIPIALDFGQHPEGGKKFALTVGNAVSDPVSFTGDWNPDFLRFFRANIAGVWYIQNGSFKCYEKPQLPPMDYGDLAFALTWDGTIVTDEVTETSATVAISGTRYGIVDGVVAAFGPNTAPAEDSGLRGAPAWTQAALETESINTSALWLIEAVNGPSCVITVDGQCRGKNAFKIRETVVESSHHIKHYLGSRANNTIMGIKLCVKGDGSRRLAIGTCLKKGVWTGLGHFDFIAEDWAWTHTSTVATAKQYIGDGWWELFLGFNVGSGSSVSCFVIEMLNIGAATPWNYLGDGASAIHVSNIAICDYGVAVVPWVLPYVPNTSASYVSSATEWGAATKGTGFDLDSLAVLASILRGPNANGHISFTFISALSSSWCDTINGPIRPSLINMSGDRTVGGVRYCRDVGGSGYFEVTDNTGAAASTVQTEVVCYEEYKISVDFGTYVTGESWMRITVNDVQGSLVPFSGTFGSGDLILFMENGIHFGYIKKQSLQVYDKPRW